MNKNLFNCNLVLFPLLKHFSFLLKSLSITVHSKQIMKILFLCLLSAWIRAISNSRFSTEFPTLLLKLSVFGKNGQKMAPY